MKTNIKLIESKIVSLVKQILQEQYDPKKLYSRNYVVFQLKKGPRELKKYIKELPHIDCVDGNGNPHICTTIPEVVYVYLQGNY